MVQGQQPVLHSSLALVHCTGSGDATARGQQEHVHEVRTVLMHAQAFGDAGLAARMDRGMQLTEHFERALQQVLTQP